MSPRNLVRDSFGYAVTQLLVRLALIVRTVLAARWLGPSAYGAWNAIQLLMDYGVLATLGTQQGLDQMVPARIVDDDRVRLDRVKRSGITNILILTLLFWACALLYFRKSPGDLRVFWGLRGLVVALVVALIVNWGNYMLTLLRSHGNIFAVNMWFMLQGAIGAAVGLALIPWFGAWGLLWGWLGGTVVAFVWTRWAARGIAPIAPLVSADSTALLRVGFPMFFFVGSSLVMRSLDRLIILRGLGAQSLGYYSLAVTAITLLMYLPDSVTYVIYPQLLRMYRSAGDRPEAIRPRVQRVLRVLTVLVPGMCGLAFLAAHDAIAAVLPKYSYGATAVRVMCYAPGALTLSNLASIVLMTTGRQLWLMPAAIGFTALAALGDIVALHQGFGISGVAWATFGSYALAGATLMALAWRAMKAPASETVREVARAVFPVALAMGLAFGLDKLVPWDRATAALAHLTRLVVEWIVFVGLYALAVRPLIRGLGLRATLAEFNLPFSSWLKRNGSNGAAP